MSCFEEFKLALIQLLVGNEKSSNLKRTADFIKEAAINGAELIILPEHFNSPYGTGKGTEIIKSLQSICLNYCSLIEYFPKNAESLQEETTKMLSQAAKENKIHLIGGSLTEKRDGKLFNTCTVWGPLGTLLAVYRKVRAIVCHVYAASLNYTFPN